MIRCSREILKRKRTCVVLKLKPLRQLQTQLVVMTLYGFPFILMDMSSSNNIFTTNAIDRNKVIVPLKCDAQF